MQSTPIPGPSFFKGFVWLVLFACLFPAIVLVIEVVCRDFIRGNSHRDVQNAMVTVVLLVPVSSLIAAVCTAIVIGPGLKLQWFIIRIIRRLQDRLNLPLVALAFAPIAAVLTWYSYDYLTPHNLDPNVVADYRHGMSIKRYLVALSCQLTSTLFVLGYASCENSPRARTALVLACCALIFIAGGVIGYNLGVH